MRGDAFEPAVEVTRGGRAESIHAAAVVVCDPEGAILGSLGDPDLVVFLRSAAKPFQAAAVVASGAVDRFGITPAETALMAGSHGGEDLHAAAAASILARAGVEISALGCGTHTPFERRTAERLLRLGERPTPLRNNCSGKHAGMLAAARAGGHPLGTYLDPDHPVQRANLAALAAFAGRPADEVSVAVDGCGAPTFGVALRGAARAFARLAALLQGAPAKGALEGAAARVARAMRAHPEMVAGDALLDTALMGSIPGLIAKVGADGVHAMAWAGPRGPVGAALKVMDGEVGRGRTAVILRVLEELGALPGPEPLPESITGPLSVRSLRGEVVGDVRAVFGLRRAVEAE
jgi:L-asparaginase II